jgi:mannose-6-phosphate isomerase-like protein (cupin superfamily)
MLKLHNHMNYKIVKKGEISDKKMFGVNFSVYPNVGDCSVVLENTEIGHNQEFYNTKSTFTYIILEGSGSFFLNDEEVKVSIGDILSILPNTRIYFKGKLKMILLASPKWQEQNEVESRNNIW